MSTETVTPTVFYTLPAHALEEGMSTADGQDVLDVLPVDGHVLTHVYTPSDDEDEDNERQCAPDARMYTPDEPVDLAVFPDTQIDGSAHPLAVIVSH